MRSLAISGLCAACAGAPQLRKELSPLAWMVGDWACEAKSLDSGSIEPVRVRFFPELDGAWMGGEMVAPGRGPKPLFELVSHTGLSEGKWTRIDVDSAGRVKTLHAEAAGDSTLWSPESADGAFRERIERKGDAAWEAAIDGRDNGGWTKQITFACRRR